MSRIHAVIAAVLLGATSLAAYAQTAPPEPKKPAAAAKAKAEPPKADAKKDAKMDAKKTVAKKPPAKTGAPKSTAAARKPEPIKMNTDKPLVLRDKDGNVIPTSPDAYNVDSARTPKKK